MKDSTSITCPPTRDDIVVDQLRVLHKPVKKGLFDMKMRHFSLFMNFARYCFLYNAVGDLTHGYRH